MTYKCKTHNISGKIYNQWPLAGGTPTTLFFGVNSNLDFTYFTWLLQNLLLVALVQKPSNKHTFNQCKVFAPKQTTTDSIVTLVFRYFAKARTSTTTARTSTARTSTARTSTTTLLRLAPPRLALARTSTAPRLAPLLLHDYYGSHLHGSHWLALARTSTAHGSHLYYTTTARTSTARTSTTTLLWLAPPRLAPPRLALARTSTTTLLRHNFDFNWNGRLFWKPSRKSIVKQYKTAWSMIRYEVRQVKITDKHQATR